MFAPLVAKPKAKSAEPQRSAVAAQRSGRTATAQVQLLQRTIGNQALARLLAQRAGAASNAPGPIQTKLKVGAVNDPLEHEADRVADRVMRMPAPEISAAAAVPRGHCKCAECEGTKLQRKSARPRAAAGEAPTSVHEVLRAPGQPLDAATRGFFEPRFGQDFSGVRVHTDAAAQQSARDVNAHAYTVEHNMVFDAGQFASGTRDGRELIAHELTHVIQQSSSAHPQLRRQPTDNTLCGLTAPEDMKPNEWLRCFHQGHIGWNSSLLRFTKNGVVATEAELVEWALREGLTKEAALSDVMGGRDFAGSQKARAEAKEKLSKAWGGFPELVAYREAEKRETEKREKLEALQAAVKDYYERGERLVPRGGRLLTIEEAAAAEKQGKNSKSYLDLVTGAKYHYGQKINRVTFVTATDYEYVVKLNEKYFYAITDPVALGSMFGGRDAVLESVAVNTEGVNVAYGYFVKAVADVAQFTGFRFASPVLATAGEGMQYGVRAAQARRSGDVLNEKPPEIGLETMVAIVAAELGGRVAGPAGKLASKFAPILAPFLENAVGMEVAGVIEKTYRAATVGDLSVSDILQPDFSIVDVLVGTVEGHVAGHASSTWTKGRNVGIPEPTPGSHEQHPPSAGSKAREEPAGQTSSPRSPHEESGGKGLSGHGQEVAPRPTKESKADAVMESVVHQAASLGEKSELKLGDGDVHGVAAYGKGEKGGFQLCSKCALVAEKLAQIEQVWPEHYHPDILRDVRFLKDKIRGLDKEVVNNRLDQQVADHAAHDIAKELEKYIGQEPILDTLLQASPEDLKANRAQWRKDLKSAIARGRFIAEQGGEHGLDSEQLKQSGHDTGKAGAGMAEKPKHHVFPQAEKLKKWFEDRGFKGEWSIDEFAVELEGASHEAIHGGGNYKLGTTTGWDWNSRVMSELYKAEAKLGGPKISRDEIFGIVLRLMREYEIPQHFVPYK
jgi:hypothetical protein